MIFYIQFLSYCLFLTFVYSWVIENLVTQSQAVYTASCNCNWISCDSLEAKQIILMTFRSQNPLQVTAGNLVPLTMNTFVQTPLVNIYRKFYGKNVLNFQLLKTSGGYISFLLAVRD